MWRVDEGAVSYWQLLPDAGWGPGFAEQDGPPVSLRVNDALRWGGAGRARYSLQGLIYTHFSFCNMLVNEDVIWTFPVDLGGTHKTNFRPKLGFCPKEGGGAQWANLGL